MENYDAQYIRVDDGLVHGKGLLFNIHDGRIGHTDAIVISSGKPLIPTRPIGAV